MGEDGATCPEGLVGSAAVLIALSTTHKIGLGAIAGAFIVFALACSFLFPRWNPNFPGRRVGLFVVMTVLFMLAELGAVEKFAAESSEAAGPAETTTTTGSTTTTPAPTGDPAAGKAVFASAGCSACHTLKEANATAKIGPNLDTALKGKDAAFIHESIVNPSAEIAHGYQNIMPPDFGKTLSSKQLDDLVALLYHAANG
jgi:mono/diheme cytochrome c family protein